MVGSWEASQDGWRLQCDIEAGPDTTRELLSGREGPYPDLIAMVTEARIASQSRDPAAAPRVLPPR